MARDVLTVHREDKLIDAAHTMIGAHVSCLVVLEDYKSVGILSERDFVKKLGMTKDYSTAMLVNNILSKNLFSVSPHISLFEAQKIMAAHKFRKLVVMENNELRGIITQTDLCKAVAELKCHYPNAPLVRDLMTTKVLTIQPDERFTQAKKLMASKDTGSIIVAEKNQILGMFTEFDLVSEFFMNPNRLRTAYMKELMTNPVICISPDFDLFQINSLMLEHNFRRLPVISNTNLVGIITQTDVVRSLYSFLDKAAKLPQDSNLQKENDNLQNENEKTTDFCVKKKGNIILYSKKE